MSDSGFIGLAASLARERNAIAAKDAASRRIAAEANANLDNVRASVLPGFTNAQTRQTEMETRLGRAREVGFYDQGPAALGLLEGQGAAARAGASLQNTQRDLARQPAAPWQVAQGLFGRGLITPDEFRGYMREGAPANPGPAPLPPSNGPLEIQMPRARPVSLTPSATTPPAGTPTLAQPSLAPGGFTTFGGRVTTGGFPQPGGGSFSVSPSGQTFQDATPPEMRDRTRGYARGTARVPGKGDGTKDTVTANLAPGEAVLNKPAAEGMGRGLIAALNAVGAQKMGMT